VENLKAKKEKKKCRTCRNEKITFESKNEKFAFA